MKLRNAIIAGALMFEAMGAPAALAQASQLGSTLTQFGATKSGTVDGLVPAYSGGFAAMSNLPQGASDGSSYGDPFAGEKPIFTVTNANMQQYAKFLSPGQVAMLDRYGNQGFRMDVYPSHRTVSYPSWVLQDTVKNAQTAQEIPGGDGVTGVYGGIPFPVPTDGYQVMWNNYLSYQAADCKMHFSNYLVDTTGALTDLGSIDNEWAEPYYDPSANTLNDKFYRYYSVRYITPAAESGTTFLFKYPINFEQSDDVTYFYSPGTRRVRLAPEYRYDTPISAYGGAQDYDELQLFYGRMDRFDFKLVGEREMLVSYNDYKIAPATGKALVGPHFLNPDLIRWEVHRVWVINATLKPGERHKYSRWNFYVDEDSWRILASESYDQNNNIYRVGFDFPWANYTQGDATSLAYTYSIYDLSKGDYFVAWLMDNKSDHWTCSNALPSMSRFTPQAIAAAAIQ
jgi:Protein of unknown function (DUF1329)